jgi:hypothetical protein
MTSDKQSFADLIEDFGKGWNRFWFTPAEALPCAVLRIVVGLLAAAHFLDLWSGLPLWFSSAGILPPGGLTRILELTDPTEGSYHVSYLSWLSGGGELTAVHVLAIVTAVTFAAGLLHRVSGALLLAAVLSYVHRAPLVAGHVEPVLSFLIAYLIIAPAGARLSVDRWLATRRKKPGMATDAVEEAPAMSANLSLRLIQVHLAMFYAMVGLTKLYGDAWWDGMAIWILLAQTESRPIDLTGMRTMGQPGEYLLNFWTHAVVYFELAFPVLVWSRLLRPIMLAISIVIWISLIIATGHMIFGLTMLAAGLAFVPASAFAWLQSGSKPS